MMRLNKYRILQFGSILVFLSILFGLPAARAEQGDPRDMLIQTVNEALDILNGENYEGLSVDEKNERLLALVESRFSLNILIQRALGRNWRNLDDEQRTEFKQLFSKLVVQTYSDRLAEAGDRPEFEFAETIELPKQRLEIQSKVDYKDDTITVFYRLAKRDGKWEVYDILVEGVSLLNNYRKQFDSILRQGSVEELLKTLREKVAEF